MLIATCVGVNLENPLLHLHLTFPFWLMLCAHIGTEPVDVPAVCAIGEVAL